MPAISIHQLGKRYQVGQANTRASYRTLRESLAHAAAAPLKRWRGGAHAAGNDFWALRDVTFDVEPGEVVGVIGHNGAGKSTLLKVLSRITKPSTGEVTIAGRVGSLLEVGTGFHPELTGRENVYLNGSILGMRRHEIRRKFDEIVAFAEVERFLDMPVKRYSSGMYVRLAFAVAAHLEPEILIVDEVLAVGDQAFQKKCVGKLGDVTRQGRTVIVVSHQLAMLANLASQAVWLRAGTVYRQGPAGDILKQYAAESCAGTAERAVVDLSRHPTRPAGRPALLRRLSIFDGEMRPATSFGLGSPFVVRVDVAGVRGCSDHAAALFVRDAFGTLIGVVQSQVQSEIDVSGHDRIAFLCEFRRPRLLPGEYRLDVSLGDTDGFLDRLESVATIRIEPEDIYGTGRLPGKCDGFISFDAAWRTAPAADLPGDDGLSNDDVCDEAIEALAGIGEAARPPCCSNL
jgi:lipopolysaccharide transport system ATP-binding protein